jgi:hypothetical protein
MKEGVAGCALLLNEVSSHMNIGKYMVSTKNASGWDVATKRGDTLGTIERNVKWKQWEFVPAYGTAFTWDCLQAMSEHLLVLNGTHKPEASRG